MKPVITQLCPGHHFAKLLNSIDENDSVTINGDAESIERFFSCFTIDTDIALAKAGYYFEKD